MQAFVINLACSTDRRAQMEARFANSGLQLEFVAAVDGRMIDRSVHPASAKLSATELGCYLSHVALWQRLASSEHSAALILEDDVSAAPDLAALCAELAQLPITPDVVRVSSVKKPLGFPLFVLGAGRRLLLPTKYPSGTQGYWLSRAGARRLLQTMATPRLPVDCAIDRYWQHGLTVLLLDPPAVWETADVISTIAQRGSTRAGWIPRQIEQIRRAFAVRRLRKALHAAIAASPAS